MKASRILWVVVLSAVLLSTLAACGPAQDTQRTQASETPDWIVKAQGWLTQVAWSAAGVPIIGPLITGILGEMAPEQHWIVGGVLILLIFSALGGGASASKSG